MAVHGRSPLEILAQQIERNEAREEKLLEELESLPRWRFRKRLEAERRLKRRRAKRARIDELLQGEHSQR